MDAFPEQTFSQIYVCSLMSDIYRIAQFQSPFAPDSGFDCSRKALESLLLYPHFIYSSLHRPTFPRARYLLFRSASELVANACRSLKKG